MMSSDHINDVTTVHYLIRIQSFNLVMKWEAKADNEGKQNSALWCAKRCVPLAFGILDNNEWSNKSNKVLRTKKYNYSWGTYSICVDSYAIQLVTRFPILNMAKLLILISIAFIATFWAYECYAALFFYHVARRNKVVLTLFLI